MLLCSTRLLREPSGARLLSALVCNLGQEPLTTPTHHSPKNPLGHAPNGAAAAAPPSRGRRRFAPPTLSQIIRLFIIRGRASVGLADPALPGEAAGSPASARARRRRSPAARRSAAARSSRPSKRRRCSARRGRTTRCWTMIRFEWWWRWATGSCTMRSMRWRRRWAM